MSIFEQLIVRRLRGRTIKRWFDFPVRLYAWHITDIAMAFDGPIRVVINGEFTQRFDTLHEHALDQVFYNERHHPLRSIAIHSRDSGVYLGPKTLYAYSDSTRAEAVATIAKIESTLKKARRGVGTFLTRTWGAAIGIAGAFMIGVTWFRPPSAENSTAVLAAGLALGAYLAATVLATVRRVRLRPTVSRMNAGFWQRNSDNLAIGILSTVIAALLVAALGSLAGLPGLSVIP